MGPDPFQPFMIGMLQRPEVVSFPNRIMRRDAIAGIEARIAERGQD